MKIFINRRIRRSPWGGGMHFLSGFADYLATLGHETTNHFHNDVDAILMMDPRSDEGFGGIEQIFQYKAHLKSIGKNVKVFHRINDTDIARNTDFLVRLNIESNFAVADHTIFISDWLKKHYEERGFSKDSIVIRNGCNHKWFYPKTQNDNDTATSSNNLIKVVTHHWSDNFNKGFDAYIELDKLMSTRSDIEFTYVGRYYRGYEPKNTKIISPMYGLALGDELRKHDVYLTAARWEACGMHHIEATSCGLPVVYHRDGGAIGEICNSHGIEFSDVKDLSQKIEQAYVCRNLLKNKIKYDLLDDQKVNQHYCNFIQKNLKGH